MNGACKCFFWCGRLWLGCIGLLGVACWQIKPTSSKIQVASLKQPPLELAELVVKPILPEVVDQKTIVQAHFAVNRAWQLYRQGAYDAAEEQLTEAFALYPLIPKANVLLGKIYLVKAAAKQELAFINSARKLFTMAAELDPNDTEAKLLLQLVKDVEIVP